MAEPCAVSPLRAACVVKVTAVLCMVVAGVTASWICVVLAAESPTAMPASIRPGTIEVGFAGALTAIEGTTHATALVRVGRFAALGHGLLDVEGELGYTHVSGLDLMDLDAGLSYQRRLGREAIYPYVAFGGGPRQEWIGSFRDVRYTVWASLGARLLAGERAATRLEYRVRRVLHDPVANFTEHQVLIGLSLLLRNTR
jgi:hypothetical protein